MIHRHERATPIIVRIPQTGSSTASPSRSTKPPLSKLGEDLRSVPEVFPIPVLIIDFDTGCVNNILGFLENSTGVSLADTIGRDGGHCMARPRPCATSNASWRARRAPRAGGSYSISSSARASRVCGMVSPRAFAVLRLMTNSKRDDCTMGKSAGFSPLSMRPA